jgi:dipeptidyl aminopeptidase/acylaminoacyl peptidase
MISVRRALPVRRALGALALASLLAAASAAQEPEVLTPHSVARLRGVGSAAISPDARWIAYVLSVPREAGKDDDGAGWSELHVLERVSGRSRPFITGKGNVGSIDWTPDGKGIAFLAKREGDKATSLYVIPVDGGEARRALGLATGIRAYSFSPDQSRVAVVAEEPEPEARKKEQEKGFKQEIYEEDWRPARLWIAKPFDAEAKPEPLSIEGSLHQVLWSPKGERIAISRTPTPLVDDEYVRQRVAVVDAGTGEVVAEVANPGKLGDIGWSPDGEHLALISAADLNDPAAGRLMIVSASGGEPADLLPRYLGAVDSFAWADSGSILYVASQGVWSVLEELDLAQREAGPKTLVPTGGPVLAGLTLSDDGQHAAFVGQSPSHPGEVFTMSHGDAAPRRLTDSNPWLADVRLAQQELVRFKARDGLEIEGLLIHPLEEQEGVRYPLVLYVHGGPEAHHSNGWLTGYSAPGQVAAARGIATFYTNYRGSTGRGVEFSKLSQGDPAGKEFDDLVDAVDHLIERGLADSRKVGVTGGSYGGYATAWLSTRYSDRFAAGVMFVGISNKISKVGTTDIPDEEFLVHARHRPWENWQLFLERSPIYHAEEAHTPLLILHGKDDPRVNPGQSREIYRHLKLHGRAPVRLVFYPGEGHGNRKAAARLDYNLRMMRWLEHYLTGPGGDPPPYAIEYAEGGKPAEAAAASEAGAPKDS